MVDNIYFFDSYAFIALVQNDIAYEPYKECRMATASLNLIEIHYILLREHGPKIANAFYHALLPTLLVFEDSIPEANQMRLEMKKRSVSAADCVGYIMALKNGIKFLTGDKEFKDVPNVEFVKQTLPVA